MAADTRQDSRPFIIWTLQRTGGTNLAHGLFERSSLPGAQHEPFNRDRAFGEVTRSWEQNHDQGALERSIREIVTSRRLIKHCVENVPIQLSEVLARAATDVGYRHLFLYRSKPLGRLLSLHFARSTDIWGPKISDKVDYSESVFQQALPVAELIAQERKCSSRMETLWALLQSLQACPVAISFEELYAAQEAQAQDRVRQLLVFLGLARGPDLDSAFIDQVLKGGDQGTRDKYARFEGVDTLQKRLEEVDVFDPKRRQLEVHVSGHAGLPMIVHAAVDTTPESVADGDIFAVEGVVVLGSPADENLELVASGGKCEASVAWGLKSEWMTQRFPDAVNCRNARFRVRGLVASPGLEYRLGLRTPGGEMRVLFVIAVGPGK